MDALRNGATLEEVVAQTKYDPWFVAQMQAMIDVENELQSYSLETLPIELLRRAKRFGLSDKQIADLLAMTARLTSNAHLSHIRHSSSIA